VVTVWGYVVTGCVCCVVVGSVRRRASVGVRRGVLRGFLSIVVLCCVG